MKQFTKRICQVSYFTLLMLLFQTCNEARMKEFRLAGGTKGRWEWVSTTTPTHIYTPQSVGYTKQLQLSSDLKGTYIAYYRNDTLQYRFEESSKDTLHTFIDITRNTVTIKYKVAGFIKYSNINLDGAVSSMTVSEPLNPYSIQADTIHSVYKSTNKDLYPY